MFASHLHVKPFIWSFFFVFFYAVNKFMLLVTTEFSYLFLDIHLQNAFSAFGVQFVSSLEVAQRTGVALCAQRGVSRISGALSSTSVQSRDFQPPTHPEENNFFFTNPVSSDPNCGGFIHLFISTRIRLPEYQYRGSRSQVWCRGSCSCQRTVGKIDFSVQGLVED